MIFYPLEFIVEFSIVRLNTQFKKNHGIFHVRILLKDIFGFTEHQDKAIYGLGYKLTLKRNIDSIVVSRNTAFADGQIT